MGLQRLCPLATLTIQHRSLAMLHPTLPQHITPAQATARFTHQHKQHGTIPTVPNSPPLFFLVILAQHERTSNRLRRTSGPLVVISHKDVPGLYSPRGGAEA